MTGIDDSEQGNPGWRCPWAHYHLAKSTLVRAAVKLTLLECAAPNIAVLDEQPDLPAHPAQLHWALLHALVRHLDACAEVCQESCVGTQPAVRSCFLHWATVMLAIVFTVYIV